MASRVAQWGGKARPAPLQHAVKRASVPSCLVRCRSACSPILASTQQQRDHCRLRALCARGTRSPHGATMLRRRYGTCPSWRNKPGLALHSAEGRGRAILAGAASKRWAAPMRLPKCCRRNWRGAAWRWRRDQRSWPAASIVRPPQTIVVTCATDGNHGRAVAWGTQRFHCRCVIFVHEAVSKGRIDAIAQYGAEVRRVAGNYDDAVREAARPAQANGWIAGLGYILGWLYRNAAADHARLSRHGG